MTHLPNVRDKPGFLHRLMDEFAGGGCMSLEGDLSWCNFAEGMVLARDEVGVLKRNTLYPRAGGGRKLLADAGKETLQ